MPIAALPTPLPAWAKALLQIAPFVTSYLIDQISYGAQDQDPLVWAHAQTRIQRNTPTGTSEDYALMTFDIVNVTGGAVDNTWTSTDWTQVSTAVSAFLSSLRGSMTTNHVMVDTRYYLRQFNAMTESKPFADTGPPSFVKSEGPNAGTIAAAGHTLPYQAACTITERTPWPKHWGRIYVPGVDAAQVDANGRWTSTVRSAFATAYQTMVTSLQANGFFPVVPVTQVDKVPTRGLLNVTQVSVDDVPDVQRRRRPRQVAARNVLP